METRRIPATEQRRLAADIALASAVCEASTATYRGSARRPDRTWFDPRLELADLRARLRSAHGTGRR